MKSENRAGSTGTAPAKNVIQFEPKYKNNGRAENGGSWLIPALLDEDNPNRVASNMPFKWVMLTEPAKLRGIYKLTENSRTGEFTGVKVILTASVKISRVVAPANTRVRGESEYHCEFINQTGQIKRLVITSSHFFKDELIRFFDGFAEVGTDRGADVHALRPVLSRIAAESKTCLKQNALDSLGWYESDKGHLEFLTINGSETYNSFIPIDRAHVAFASELKIDARGGVLKKPDEKILNDYLRYLIIHPETLERHPDYDAMLFGAMGFIALMMYPHILDDGAFFKRAPYELDIVGMSGSGKSVFASIIKWFFTQTEPPPGDFRLPADFVEERHGEKKGDTLIGRNYKLAAAGNIPLIDFDFRRVTDSTDQSAEKRTRLRIGSIESLANNDGGGSIGTRNNGARQRVERQGGLIRTLEDDPALVTLPLYWSTEKRSNVYTWPQTEDGTPIRLDYDVSVKIVKHHITLYQWGALLRCHLMSIPKLKLVEYFKQKTLIATEKLNTLWPEPHSDASWQRMYTIQTIAGVLIWIDALRAFALTEKRQSIFAEWLESGIADYVANRRARFDFLLSLYESDRSMSPANIYLKTLRKLLRFGDAYIARQSDGLPLSDSDFNRAEIEPVDLGYTYIMDLWKPKRLLIGYLSNDREWLLMHPDSFDIIKDQAKRDGHSVLSWNNSGRNPVYDELAKLGLIAPDNSSGSMQGKKAKRAYIAEKRGRYLHVKLSAINGEDHEQDSEQNSEIENGDN